MDEAQVSHQVAEDRGREDGEPANRKGYLTPAELAHQRTPMPVGAVERCHLAEGPAARDQPFHFSDDPARLALVVRGLDEINTRPFLALGLQSFLFLVAVILRDDHACGTEDFLRRAIVAVEIHGPVAGEGAVKHLEGAVRGAAKAVDGLVVVAHGGDVEGSGHQPAQQLHLGEVGVLELVHQDVPVLLPAAIEHFRITVEQPDRLADQAAQTRARGFLDQSPAITEDASQLLLFLHLFPFEREVRRRRRLLPACRAKARRYRRCCGHRTPEGRGAFEKFFLDLADVRLEVLRLDQLVLAAREELVQVVKEGAWLGQLPVEVELQMLHTPPQENPDVDRIKQAPVEVTLAQKVVAEGVEGGYARGLLEGGQCLLHAGLHLACGLLGEGQRQDVSRPKSRLRPAHRFEQMYDALGNDARLSAAGPGNDQKRSLAVLDRLELFGVKLQHGARGRHPSNIRLLFAWRQGSYQARFEWVVSPSGSVSSSRRRQFAMQNRMRP